MKKTTLLLAAIAASLHLAHAQNVVPGSTQATFDVSSLGGASYTIPIKVPPGAAGLQPSLSLSYNSQGDNGIMGMGWSLTGMSAITRVPSSIYNDKACKGVSLTAADKFALDGNRLLVTSGTYGAASSQYHTETESFKTIVANGTLGSGPASFTVTAEDGTVYEYGAVGNSLVTGSGITEPYMWLLDKVTLPTGVYMTYEYVQPANGEALISKISYNYNLSTGSSQSYISFSYADRSDYSFAYAGGCKMFLTRKLSNITCYQMDGASAWHSFRSYNLVYSDDFYTHLTSVTENGQDNTDKRNPTAFTYGTANNLAAGNCSVLQSNDSYNTCMQGDYNGDGKTDIITYSKDINKHGYTLYLSNGSGSFTQMSSGTFPSDASLCPNCSTQSIYSPSQQTNLPFDYDGDGKQDVIVCQSVMDFQSGTKQTYWVSLSSGSGFTPSNQIVGAASTSSVISGYFGKTMPLAGDFDGDGRSEFLIVSDGTYASGLVGYNYATPALTRGTDGQNHPVLLAYMFGAAGHPALPFNTANGAKLYVIDYNGDGKSEILWVNGGTSYIYEMKVNFDNNNNPDLSTLSFTQVSTGVILRYGMIFLSVILTAIIYQIY